MAVVQDSREIPWRYVFADGSVGVVRRVRVAGGSGCVAARLLPVLPVRRRPERVCAGHRVMASLTRFVGKRLRLRVNRTKSAAAHARERKFLGYRLLTGGRLAIAPRSLTRAGESREITRRNRGVGRSGRSRS